jgi:ubiquinone/menaquinone biosynthesis C-methylase UbiE
VPRRDFYATPFGSIYSAYMEHERVGRALARVLWGADTRPYYEYMEAIAAMPTGATIVDCPCGAGPAFRALRPAADVRYVAVDLSPAMLRRARRRAARRDLAGVEFYEGSATDLPLADDSADLFLSFWGLHVFREPRAAVAEIGRVLKPGGLLRGAAFVSGTETFRQRFLVRPDWGDFGPVGTAAETLGWFAEARIELTETRRGGAMFFFSGKRA